MAHKNYDVIIQPGDVKNLYGYMDVELQAYNNFVNTASSQLIRDPSVLASLNQNHVNLLSHMIKDYKNIYIAKVSDLPESYSDFIEVIQNMTASQRFLINKLAKKSNVDINVHRRMVTGMLEFYIQQAQTRTRNSHINDSGDFISKAAYDNLTPYSSFNSRHLHIDRKSCRVVKMDGTTFIFNPYSKKPLMIQNDIRMDWTMMVLKQSDQINTLSGDWEATFYQCGKSVYMFKQVERRGSKSSIFESYRAKL